MAGQQALQNFLNQPSPAMQQRAALQAQKQQHQILMGNQQAVLARNQNALAQQRLQQQGSLAQQRIDISRGNLGLRGAAEQRRQGDQLLRGAELEAQGLRERVGDVTQRVSDWADRMPTPGGIGVLLLLIFFLLWAVVPVNRSDGKQHTRLELLWLTLTGRTQMAKTPEGGVGGGSGVGGGEASNGHLPTPMQSLLSSLPIRDWGANP